MEKEIKDTNSNGVTGEDCCQHEGGDGAFAKDELDNRNENSNLLDSEEEYKKVLEERDSYLAMAQRLQAEFDNFRKRNKDIVAETFKDALYETVGNFLPVLDNLQRGLDSSGGDLPEKAKAIYDGMEKVNKQFIDILDKMGVSEIKALGEVFDPTYHDAVMQIEAKDEDEKNRVVEVLLRGYICGDTIIRHSMVKVAI